MNAYSEMSWLKFMALVETAALLTACNVGGGTFAVPNVTGESKLATHQVRSTQEQLRSPVVAACPARRGQPRCLVLVHTGVTGNVAGWTATNLQSAYNLNNEIGSRGSGQIVAIVDADDNPNVASDLAFYRSFFGLPAANFTKYNQNGQQGDYRSLASHTL